MLTVLPADIDEERREGEAPMRLVHRLACEKAKASAALAHETAQAQDDPDGLLVAADTIVWDDSLEALGKPADAADAARMLAELSGRAHHVSTGVCVLRLSPAGDVVSRRSFVETTDVEFWELEQEEIDAYVASGEPLDKAGAYGIQGLGRTLVKGIAGDYFNVVGLPVSRLVREIKEL